MVDTFFIVICDLFFRISSRIKDLVKPAVRKVFLELLAPLQYHLETMPEDKDCAVQEDIALEVVKYCIALTDNLLDLSADE